MVTSAQGPLVSSSAGCRSQSQGVLACGIETVECHATYRRYIREGLLAHGTQHLAGGLKHHWYIFGGHKYAQADLPQAVKDQLCLRDLLVSCGSRRCTPSPDTGLHAQVTHCTLRIIRTRQLCFGVLAPCTILKHVQNMHGAQEESPLHTVGQLPLYRTRPAGICAFDTKFSARTTQLQSLRCWADFCRQS